MSSELKRELCDSLLENNMVKPFQFITHSYTNHRIENGLSHDQYIGICPALTTRCDCLGVVVYENKIIGEKENEINN